MKRMLLFIVIALLFTACSPAQPAAPASAAVAENSTSTQTTEQESIEATAMSDPAAALPADGEIISIEFTDAANLRSQLAYGTMRLEGMPEVVSPEQAKTLLPLWLAMRVLSGTTTTVPEELTAVQDQIIGAMQPDQLQAIAGMQITNAALTVYYAEQGIVLPTPVAGETKVPGANKDLSEEDRQATRTAKDASGVATGSGQLTKTLLYDEVIELLTERAAQ